MADMSVSCFFGFEGCKQPVVAEVTWQADCEHKTSLYCARHAPTRLGLRPWCARCGKTKYKTVLTITPYPSTYGIARQAWLDHGYLADKDKMTDAVTLTVPAEWDVYGSIMYDKPAPVRQHRIPALVAGQVAVVAVLIIVAFMLGAMLT